jgi:hypothetical protein
MSPELAPPGWRPVFLDYLHLGFTNATAFSPTEHPDPIERTGPGTGPGTWSTVMAGDPVRWGVTPLH